MRNIGIRRDIQCDNLGLVKVDGILGVPTTICTVVVNVLTSRAPYLPVQVSLNVLLTELITDSLVGISL